MPFQVGQFLGAGFPAQHRIAVGEAAEAGDDLAVRLGVTGELLHLGTPGLPGQFPEQLDTALLGRQVFAVLQGQVQEHPVNGGQLPAAAGNGIRYFNLPVNMRKPTDDIGDPA